MAAKPGAGEKLPELPFFAGLPRVLDIAHRGASVAAPEHTVSAYELALRHGAHVLELDLRSTRDGELVVAHDASLERALGLEGRFAELTWSELQRLAGDRTPLRLAQVFSLFPEARFNLELKDESLDAARALAELVRASGMDQRVLVASWHTDVLAEFRRRAPSVATSASFHEGLTFCACHWLGRSCAVPYAALQVPAIDWLGLTDPSFVRRAHAAGVRVHYWTVDAPARQRALVEAGADGIMTNRPDVLRGVLETRVHVSQP